MIKIDDKLVEHLLKLSRLTFDDKDRLKNDLQKIINYFEILSEVNTEGLEPMYTPIEEPCILREKEPVEFENIDGIIENFPEKDNRLIKVPGIYG
ncbi:MAG: Asp-tRNA(Asn)/Glu-tRNA(Gln) amidotransferase subunit GatC [Fervidobacterium sp.]|uniref:Aspartyl/glutamyl-tRNA(Asn/Gln) amidotransferase subunit C n=1 Tax=Fervidobacterium gondwanense DSM 13020 TaxID=1121883 RepID=A0A1M7RU55_FERGO|nr:Asp-tRNA(Asn)/Glu-tRNA(Gln) amidotransferase subunit GatC [Fervidobacterium gondwanense]UXF01899.1 glutamyl-tRNA amidotransferase [Fervidobacterium riparium]SHN49793.1 aspartyl/glutamyl-tRNA(Asn/Gln) amidotransferase subunit C [Fervidobacterium gondwanense DSM 13020]